MRLGIVNFFFAFYRLGISPLLHGMSGFSVGCRFEPSCSVYAQAAFSKYSLRKGGLLAIYRIFRCHPFSSGGVDPVP